MPVQALYPYIYKTSEGKDAGAIGKLVISDKEEDIPFANSKDKDPEKLLFGRIMQLTEDFYSTVKPIEKEIEKTRGKYVHPNRSDYDKAKELTNEKWKFGYSWTLAGIIELVKKSGRTPSPVLDYFRDILVTGWVEEKYDGVYRIKEVEGISEKLKAFIESDIKLFVIPYKSYIKYANIQEFDGVKVFQNREEFRHDYRKFKKIVLVVRESSLSDLINLLFRNTIKDSDQNKSIADDSHVKTSLVISQEKDTKEGIDGRVRKSRFKMERLLKVGATLSSVLYLLMLGVFLWDNPVLITSSVSKALVRINPGWRDEKKCETPCFIGQGLFEESNTIVVSKDGYLDKEKKFYFKGGGDFKMMFFKLNKKGEKSRFLNLKSIPSGADIFVNGKKQETKTPASPLLPMGTDIKIRLEKSGYFSKEYHIDESISYNSLLFELEPIKESENIAKICVNGKSREIACEINGTILGGMVNQECVDGIWHDDGKCIYKGRIVSYMDKILGCFQNINRNVIYILNLKSETSRLEIRDVKDLKKLRTIYFENYYNHMSFLNDKFLVLFNPLVHNSQHNLLLTTGDRLLTIIDISRGEIIASLNFKNLKPVISVSISKDNRYMAVLGENGKNIIYDIQNRKKITSLDLNKNITHIAFIEDGSDNESIKFKDYFKEYSLATSSAVDYDYSLYAGSRCNCSRLDSNYYGIDYSGLYDIEYFLDFYYGTITAEGQSKRQVKSNQEVLKKERLKKVVSHYGIYERKGESLVKDNRTGLIWQGKPLELEPYRMKNYCMELMYGGYSDWRLPTIQELDTLVKDNEYARWGKDVWNHDKYPYKSSNAKGFAGYINDLYYAAHDSGQIKIIDFRSGDISTVPSYSYYCRCVRGGKIEKKNVIPFKKAGCNETRKVDNIPTI